MDDEQQGPVGEVVATSEHQAIIGWCGEPQPRGTKLYTSSPARQEPLTAREVELIDGMIEVQLHHAEQCDRIANRTMADKQKGWDMERVELLRKLKEKNA